jgi:hypothetical protein
VSLSLFLCVPALVHLCPCPYGVPVSGRLCPVTCRCLCLFLFLSSFFPVRLCPYPSLRLSVSPLSLFLSICVYLPVCLCPCPCACPSVSLSTCVPIHLRPCPYPDNFQRLIYCQINQWITFKATFVANGQLSVLITSEQPATDNFQRLLRPIQQTKSTEATF